MTDKTVDAKALEAASQALTDRGAGGMVTASIAITAYLSALPHAGVSEEMVEAERAEQRTRSRVGWSRRLTASKQPLSSQHAEAMPVAWRWKDGDLRWQSTCDEDRASYAFRVDGFEVHDLYASPVPAYAEPGIKARVAEFAQAILHGDEEHRGWLIEAAEAFNSDAPLPEPRGKGTNSAIRSALVPTTSPAKGGAEVGTLATALEEACGVLETLVDDDSQHVSDETIWAQAIAASRKGRSALRTSAPVGQTAKEGE